MPSNKRPVILILGGGFGGAYCAQALEKRLKNRCDIILIDRNNYFIFYPLLIEAGTGDLEPRHAVISIRQFLKHTQFQMGEIKKINLPDKKVQIEIIQNGMIKTFDYDHLVLALGSVTNLPDIKGLQEHGFEMKSLLDAVALRDRAIQLMELADAAQNAEERQALLHFVVVGANFTGVEVAGQFDEFLKKASHAYSNVKEKDCKVTLLERSDRILNVLDKDLSHFASKRLDKRGINVVLNTTVSQISPDHVILTNKEKILSHTVVWCAGIAPNPLLSKIDVALDQRGYILCENDLRVKGRNDIWAIGDTAVNTDTQGKPYPATAQHAVKEAKALATNIQKVLNSQPTKPCDLKTQGTLAALGCRTAVAKVFGIKLSGFWAWFLWRTVYLSKMPGWSRRLRITLDWTMDLLFNRDYVQLGVHQVRKNSHKE